MPQSLSQPPRSTHHQQPGIEPGHAARSRGPLSTDLDDPDAVPYFLWDEPMTVKALHERLRTASEAEQLRLLGKILREARDWEVWTFTTPHEVARLWPKLTKHLGRRRAFWTFLLGAWSEQGLIEFDAAG